MLKNQKDRHLTPSASIKCRLAHMALDINSSTILARIYDTTTPLNIVTLEMWKILAADYVNNPMWQPSRAIDDTRVMEIGKPSLHTFYFNTVYSIYRTITCFCTVSARSITCTG